MRTTALALLLIINNRRQTVHDCKAESTKFVLEDLPFDGIGFDSPRLQPNSVGRVKPPTFASSNRTSSRVHIILEVPPSDHSKKRSSEVANQV